MSCCRHHHHLKVLGLPNLPPGSIEMNRNEKIEAEQNLTDNNTGILLLPKQNKKGGGKGEKPVI